MINYTDITKKQITETVTVFALLAVLGGLYFKINEFYYIAAILLFASLLFPWMIKPAAFIWWNFSLVLSWLSSRIILTILFLILVIPVALIRRLMGKDALQLKAFKKISNSAYIQKNHSFTEADLKYPF